MDKTMKKGTLYLIPTVIGDSVPESVLPAGTLSIILSLRHFIVEESTTGRRLLRKSGYRADFEATTLLVFNEHSGTGNLLDYLEPAMQGNDVGLLSEAGVPCVADPGAAIVEAAHQLGIRVVPLTGPSSILLALMASGFNGQSFTFHGYLPIEKTERARKIRELERTAKEKNQTQVFIETPYRNRQMLAAMAETCSRHTRICIALDLTLESEEILVKTAGEWKGEHPEVHKRPAVFLLSA
jgi:16S rRNA (cytidine1402-2'-O)-methyltransferase